MWAETLHPFVILGQARSGATRCRPWDPFRDVRASRRCRTFDVDGTAPPSVLPDISPTWGEIGRHL
ncbi:MAG: hypothetical protein E5X63_32775 [Mesorhizobium sp.]|nr:MAG: hypothetical protein E5X63_32775 [Mesorhizobium sp.]